MLPVIYMGLHEFENMAFLLHFLRKEDLFFDIGADIGSYTILASGHVGAHTFAFEPIPSTFQSLANNVAINRINDSVIEKRLAAAAPVTIFSETF